MDVLSDVLNAVHLTGAVYFDIRARAPWVAATPPMSAIGRRVMPAFEHVIAFHVMLEGQCWVHLDEDPSTAVRLETGDAVIIACGKSHTMGSDRGVGGSPNLDLYARPRGQTLPYVFHEFGGSGETANVVCGYLGCDATPFNPILGSLPGLLRVGATSLGGSLINDLIRVVLCESERPSAGGETILAKLSEVLFLQAVRQYLDTLPSGSTGWLSGLRDRHVGTALGLMHARPAEHWTLDTLAREAGLSRSAFAERFAALVGTPPMQYLANWRLQIAAQLIVTHGMSIAQAGAEVGYESDAAFSRAFKKQVGAPPASWRRARLAAGRA